MSVKTLAAVLLLAQVLAAVAAPHHRAAGDKKRKDKDNCVVVVMKSNATRTHKQKLFDDTDGDEAESYDNIFNGFHKCVKNPQQLAKLAADPNVEYIQDTVMVQLAAVGVPNTQQSLNLDLWNLDRIDQAPLARNNVFNYKYDGTGVRIYVVDTGLRAAHGEFTGRVIAGRNFYLSDRLATDTTDCNGHGTHVASTAAGRTYGVAKGARIVPVRVFGCTGGSTSNIILSALNWIATQAKGVINMSLGGGIDTTQEAAVKRLTDLGFHVVVSAGNDNVDACTQSPARAPSAITVASTTSTDAKSSFSNWGSCVDIQAPGSNILGAAHNSNTGSVKMSGTSMASPLVAGIVATIMEQYDVSSASMASGLVQMGQPNYISGLPAGTPNKLANNQWCFITNGLAGCRTVTITVRTDAFPAEIGWNIWQSCPFTQAAYASITAANSQLTWTVCLAPRSYTFVARDSFGDGWGTTGWFRVTMGTTTLIAQTSVSGTGLTRTFTVPALAAAGAKHAVQSDENLVPVLMISNDNTSPSSGDVQSHNDHLSLLDDETQRLSGRRTTVGPVSSLTDANGFVPPQWLMAGTASAGVICGVLATVAIAALRRRREDTTEPRESVQELECVPSPASVF